jgi:hypothetical protein
MLQQWSDENDSNAVEHELPTESVLHTANKVLYKTL